MANLYDWLESLTQIAATPTGGTTIARELGISQIHDIIAQYLRGARGGMSANIQLLHDKTWIVIIDGTGRAVYQGPIPKKEMHLLLDHVRNLGIDTEKVSRVVVARKTLIVRVTPFTVGGDYAAVFIRFNMPRAFPLESLDGQVIPKGSGRLMVKYFVFSPRGFLVICGPGASGKSTLLNAIMQQAIIESQHHPISVALYAGDATDVFVPDGVVFIPALPLDDAVVALRSANTRHIVVGETVSATTREVIARGLPAASGGATTTHGTIEEAAAEIPKATFLVEMNRLGETVVAVRAAYRRTAKDPLIWLWNFNIATGQFETNTSVLEELWVALERIERNYYQTGL